ncbi:MAG: hypothetical protein Q4A32_04245 [Lachnospiraceae bacterium]|nr:hypothetical protein [Lachnospiraceae bacterium]
MIKLKTAAAAALMIAILAGCGQNARTAIPDDSSYIPEDELSVDESLTMIGNDAVGKDESLTWSEMIKTAGDTESTKGNIKEELPNYLKADPDEESAPEPAENPDAGEGTNVEAGTEIKARANAVSCSFGETYTVHTDIGDIDLKVDSIDIVANKDKSISAKKIARIPYSYTNVSGVSGLIIDSIFFRLADDEGKAITMYLPDYSLEENPEPKVVEKGETCEAVIAFALYEDTDELTLFFDDLTTGMGPAQELYWVTSVS